MVVLGTAATADTNIFATSVQGSTADSAVQPGDLSSVAFSGSYPDLINIPTTFTPAAHTHVVADITDFPVLATVATSGSYSDLTNIPASFNPSSHTHTVSEITDFPVLATVATSGSYNDLLNLPSLFDGAYSSLSGIPTTFTPSAHTHTVSEINDLTATVSELNILDGVIASTAQINQLSSNTFGTLTATTSLTTPLITRAGTLALSATGAHPVTISTNGVERMRITSTGNVGIGTTSPSERLDVNGTVRATGLNLNGTAVTATAADLNTVRQHQYASRLSITANTTLTAADHAGRYIEIGGSGPTLNLPATSTMPGGTTITVHNYGTAAATISRQGSDQIAIYGSSVTTLSVPVGQMVMFVSAGSGFWLPTGPWLYAVGMGQTWQDLTASRAQDVTYTNTTGRTIGVSVYYSVVSATREVRLLVGGRQVSTAQAVGSGSLDRLTVSALVPPGSTYRVEARFGTTATLSEWAELR
jgi:hypothetical protein